MFQRKLHAESKGLPVEDQAKLTISYPFGAQLLALPPALPQ